MSLCWQSCVPLSVCHTSRTSADCHSHCLITPHPCLCLILLLLLWASRLPQILEGLIQLETLCFPSAIVRTEQLKPVISAPNTFSWLKMLCSRTRQKKTKNVSTPRPVTCPSVICRSDHVSATVCHTEHRFLSLLYNRMIFSIILTPNLAKEIRQKNYPEYCASV